MKKIRVSVIKKTGRTNLYLLARNGETGERFERSARTKNRKEAEKLAVEWRIELEHGYRPELITWVKFVERYETEHLSELRKSSQLDARGTLKMFTAMASPTRLRDLDESRVATFRKGLQDQNHDIAMTTVAKHLRNLQAAVSWATEQKLLPHPPKIRMPKKAKGSSEAKGRPITAEEFDRMEAVADKVVGPELVKGWLFLLRGLWWSGLRLGEALSLSWDEWHDGLTVVMTEEFVLLRIPAEHEKGGKNRLLAIAPQFAEMLRSVPASEREGFVFKPQTPRARKHHRPTRDRATRIISRIGEKAGIVVARQPKEKFASAHDCRRAFGNRWAKLVTPAVLKELMRHSQIETTMKFYVGSEAEETARLLQRVMAFDDHTTRTAKPMERATDRHSVDSSVDTQQ
jgi:integrase